MTTMRKKTPHIEKNVPNMERMYICTHRKNAPIGEKKPPIQLFYSCSAPPPPPPGECLLFLPLATANHDRLHSLYSVCLRELEKINKN